MTWSVYVHTFPNGKRYVGMTSQNPERRWHGKCHGYHNQSMMADAINEYGWENVTHEVLCTCDTKIEAERIERDFIRFMKTNQIEYGYNVQPGGSRPKGYKFCEEVKKRIRESGCHCGPKNSNYGKTMSAEQRAKLSAAHKGKKMKPESAKQGALKRKGEKAYNARKVAVFDLNGVLLGIYGSLADAGRENGVRTQDVFNTCCGKQKTCHGKRYEYADRG